MKTYKANDLFVIRPMRLINQQELKKLKRFLGIYLKHSKQDYLSLAKDIQIAEKGTYDETFKNVFSETVYPIIHNDEFPDVDFKDNQDSLLVHSIYVKNLLDVLFCDACFKNGYEIDNSSFDLNQLRQFRAEIIAREKNRLISIKEAYSYDCTSYLSGTSKISIHSRVARGRELRLLNGKTRN